MNSSVEYRVTSYAGHLKLISGLGISVFAVIVLLSYLIWSGYREAIHTAEITTRNYAELLEQGLDAALRRADADLLLVGRTFPNGALSKAAVSRYAGDLDAKLDLLLTKSPELSGARVFDAAGDLLYSSDRKNVINANIADRPHFRRARDSQSQEPIFSDVILGRTVAQKTLIVIRPLRDANGNFRGVVAATVDFGYFLKLFASLKIGDGGNVAFYRSDTFSQVLRWPVVDDKLNVPLPQDSPTRLALANGTTVAAIQAVSAADGKVRIYSYDVLRSYPFFVSVGISRDDALANWYVRSIVVGVSALLLLGLLIVLLARLLRSEASQKKSGMRLSLASEAGAVGIWELDSATGKAWRSPYHAKIFGYPVADNKWGVAKFLEHVVPDDRARIQKLIAQAPGAGSIAFECRITRLDGTVRWIAVKGEALRGDAGTAGRLAGTVQDITERKAAEAEIKTLNSTLEQRVRERTANLEIANKELEAFSYSVAHDLRTPLRSVAGFTTLIAQDCAAQLDVEGKALLQRVQAATVKMGDLIDGLLKLSNLMRSNLGVETVDLAALARSVAETLGKNNPARNVMFVIPPELKVRGDKRLLTVLVENLLGNAWKFTRKQPDARIELGVMQKDGGPVYFVRDNGAGFDMAHAASLFRPFYRLHDVREYPGHGIGLATVQRVIERHGGRVWGDGAVGRGATFFFTLSIAEKHPS